MFYRKKGLPAGRRGFTLIELLVVIAIIGILATIVLINLNAARNKAKDAAVKGALSEGRAAAEMAYDNAGGSYAGVCTDGDVLRIGVNVKANNGNVDMTCVPSATAYCMQSPLVGGGKWCIDYKGFSGTPIVDCAAGNIECD